MKKLITIVAPVLALTTLSTVTHAEKALTFSHWAGPKHAMATDVYPWLNEKLSECTGGELTVKLENGLAHLPLSTILLETVLPILAGLFTATPKENSLPPK